MLLIFNSEFLLSLLLFLAFEVLLIYVYVMDVFRHFSVPLIMAAALIYFVIRWSRQFLVRMIVDYDANNGDGRVVIQRLVPSPNLPETVQFPLQQAAEGSPEVNTKGFLNTLISQVKMLKFLRPLTIGDLTLRGPAAPFGITMYNIKDPGGVKSKLEQDWKKILTIKNREKAEREKKEEIDRIKEGVRLGIKEAYESIKVENAPLYTTPPMLTPPPTLLREKRAEYQAAEDLSDAVEVKGQIGEGDGSNSATPSGGDVNTPMGSTSLEGGADGSGSGGGEGGNGGAAPAA